MRFHFQKPAPRLAGKCDAYGLAGSPSLLAGVDQVFLDDEEIEPVRHVHRRGHAKPGALHAHVAHQTTDRRDACKNDLRLLENAMTPVPSTIRRWRTGVHYALIRWLQA